MCTIDFEIEFSESSVRKYLKTFFEEFSKFFNSEKLILGDSSIKEVYEGVYTDTRITFKTHRFD
jgi:hypothetical protein